MLFLITLILASVMLIAAQSRNASGRLEEGRRAELNLGLEPAIKIYESVLSDFPNDKPNGAAALVRIIKIYDDFLNQSDKAAESCQRLLRGYPNQPEIPKDVLARCNTPMKARSQLGVFIAEMDPATLTARGAVHSLSEANIAEGTPTFSPDGHYLAFRRAKTANAVTQPTDPTFLFVRTLENKTEVKISTCDELFFGGRTFWLPDSKSLFSVAAAAQNQCLSRSDRQTGQLLQSMLINLGTTSAALSPDGKKFYHTSAVTVFSTIVNLNVAVDVLTGKISDPFALPMGTGPAAPIVISTHGISPDGRTLGFIRNPTAPIAHLVLFDTSGTDRHYREVFQAGTRMQDVSWSKDGKRILSAVSEDGVRWRIIQIPAEGGTPTFTGLEITGLVYFEPNRENTQIVFDGLAYSISAPGPYTPPPAPSNSAQPTATNSTTNSGGGSGARGQ
jgi:Tol biopolymer transport system component